MSFLNRLCLSFLLGLFVSLVLARGESVWLLFGPLLFVLVLIFRPSRADPSRIIVFVFLFLGLLRGGRAYDRPVLLDRLSDLSRQDVLEVLRRAAKSNLADHLPEPHASLAYGIVFGGTGNFDRSFLSDLRRTGTSHMVAVSGYNVSIIINILLNTSFLLVSRGLVVIGFLVLIFYDLLVGFSPSVTRASIMGLYLFAASLFGRQKNLTDALLFSAALILALTPRAFFDLGFELSFVSMLGLVYLGPIFARLFVFLPRQINEVLSTTLAAQIMILPLSLYYFNQVSYLSPLANLLTFFAVPGVTALTVLQLGLSLLPMAEKLVAAGNFLLLDYFVTVVKVLARV